MKEQPTNVEASPDFHYLDVMATAFAFTRSNTFLGSLDNWSIAWQEALREPDAQALLPNVFFRDNKPYPPSSKEVESLVRTLSRSGILQILSPSGIFITNDSSKESVRNGNAAIIESHGPTLQRIADALDKHVGVQTS